jgi:outer membrane protein assembly factor BamB
LAIATVQGDLETIKIENGRAIQSLGFGSAITSDLLSFDYTGSYSSLMLPKQTRSKAAVVAGTEQGTLYCYDLETLQELWKFEQPADAIIGKPLFAKGAILFYSLDGFLYSINAQSGLLNWKSKLTDKNESKILASELTNNSDDVFISLTNGKIFSYDILLGKRNWQYDKYKLFTSLKVSGDGRLIYGKSTNDRFHILSAQLGTWVREIITKIGNDKINTDITELGKNIYFGNEEGYLVQVDENYGVKKIFRNSITPLYSITVVSKNKLILGYHNGTISLIRIKD